MKVSDYVIEYISRQGVSHIFEMIGGAIAHLVDSVHKRTDMECVSMHHEQAAAFAAEGYARVNGRLGVAMATSGPGALNLLTGIGSCYFDSVPCLFITGQVNTYEFKFDKPVRQLGFQETDIVSIARPIVKYAQLITDPAEIRYCLEKAVFLAMHGRPGPVLLDLPMNIQRAEINPEELPGFFQSKEYKACLDAVPACSSKAIGKAVGMIEKARRPLILAGGGLRGGAAGDFRQFAERTGIPVVHTLMGLDALPGEHPLSAGLIGAYGNRYGNLALANCDLLLIAGARLDTRQTGTNPQAFARQAVKIHVDIDASELNHKVPVELAIHCDLSSFFHRMRSALPKEPLHSYASWLDTIRQYRAMYPSGSSRPAPAGIDPNRFMELLSSRSRPGDIIVLDVGQHQMWASQSFRLQENQRLLNAGGMGAMGFALPAAIGAAKAAPGRRVIVICGDGGFQVNLQELQTIVALRLPVVIFVMNNSCLGMVRQFQDMYFEGRRQSTVLGYSCPDPVKVAAAFGLAARVIASGDDAVPLVDEAMGTVGGMLVEVKVGREADVIPKLPVGKPLEDMAPALSREELASVMLVPLWEDGQARNKGKGTE